MFQPSHILALLPFLLCLGVARGEEAEAEVKVTREPRLFYVSTTSSTTTLFTQTVCYMSSNVAPVACGKRKKRFADFDLQLPLGSIEPSRQSSFEGEEESAPVIDASKDLDTKREPKFLVYWLTTTSLSTMTSFTRTLTFASLICTPSGYTNVECGK